MSRAGNVTRIALQDGRQIIGGGAQCDIVALGMSSEPAFAIEIFQKSSRRAARLNVLRDDVFLQKMPLPHGHITPLCSEQIVSVDGIEFWLEGVDKPSPNINRRKSAAACLLAVSLLLLLAGLSGGAGDGDMASTQNGQRLFRSSETTSPAVLIDELRAALRMSGLAVGVSWNDLESAIDLGEPGQGLSVGAKSQLSNLIEAFSRRSEAPLRDRTRLTSGVEHLVASVALEPVKFIVGTDGKRYREGDAIGGEWKVESISPDVISVARGGQRDDFSLFPSSETSSMRLASNGGGAQQ